MAKKTSAVPDTAPRCVLCGRVWYGGVDQAASEGAVPDFWVSDRRVEQPACSSCVDKYLLFDDDGEVVARPGEVRQVLSLVSHWTRFADYEKWLKRPRVRTCRS